MKWRSNIALLLGLLLVAAVAAADDTEAQFKRISHKLVCQCGCNYLLAECQHLECPSAIPLRKQIREYLKQGMNEQAVIDAMVKEHGMVLLAAPPARGFNLAAWVIPFVALAVGFFIVRQALVRMRARARAKTPAATTDESLRPYEERLAAELRELEEETSTRSDTRS